MKQAIIDLLNKNDLSRVSDQIVHSIKDSVIFETRTATENRIPVGKSKLGGSPDLPPEIEWPSWKDRPLSFVAQINLVDLPKAGFLEILPATGILYFFYSARQETWGFRPEDKGSWRVIYGNVKKLERRDFPRELPDHGKYKSCSIKFQLSVTIPSWQSINVEALNLSELERDRFLEFSEQVRKLIDAPSITHRLLGHPDEIQNEMQLECQLASNSLYRGNETGFRHSSAQVLKAATDWELLLQIDTDDHASMMWGDVGRLYYWIPLNELRQRNFDASWMILQCC